MPAYRELLHRQLAAQNGVINLRQVRATGCADSTRDRLLRSGELVPILPGVYRSAAWPMGREQLKVAACLRNPAAALAFSTAGQEWGLRRMTDRRVHVLVPHGVSPELEGIVVHRCRRIDSIDLVERTGGIRVTSVARTLFDVGAVVGRRRLESALEQALDKGLVDYADVAEAIARLYHRRRPGSLEIRDVVSKRASWSTAVQSELELRVLAAIRRAGLPEPVVQHSVALGDGTSIRFDFAWPSALVALEVDHAFWHTGSDESTKDKSRDRRAAAHGWLTLRITDDDVNHRLDVAMAEIAAVVRSAMARMGR